MAIDIEKLLLKIKPVGSDENGKYNKKLYNMLRKLNNNKKGTCKVKVWFNTKSRWDGSHIEYHKNIHRELGIKRQIIIDPSGQLVSGYFLGESLDKNNPTRWSLCTFHPNHMIDITEWFFNTYIQIGRCMFDKDHYDFDNSYNQRYHIINKNSRKCRYCGEHFKRQIKKVVEVKKYEVWRPLNETASNSK